ncbi:hypothetical protein FRC06_005916 [Ceratobasidium sp. 370]|nr:hypothetical protein FRC06_005916 [Ceratobasidium sp. 370]
MEVRYPVKVLYTLGTSQLMLARADAIECRPVKPRPNAAKPDEKHASTTLKDCLSALCTASPELLADPRTDHSVYALDPLQTPELMVGRGLLTWLMAESGRVVGTIREDYVDGEEMQVLEIRLSLAPTVAVSRAQHASSLQNISQPPAPTASANPSPPSTPSGLQTTRASMRIRIKSTTRAKEKAAVAAAAPQVPKKRGRQKRSGPPPQAASTPGPVKITSSAPDTPIAGPSVVSPVPSRDHSRVSSVSSLALPQTQAQHQSQPRPPTSFGSTSTSASNQSSQPSRLPSQTPQPQSPNRSLARLLLAASASSSNASNSSNVGTPLFDSLVERLKTTGLLAQLSADQSTATDSQSQALLSFLGRISSRKRAPRETPLHAQTDLPLVSGPFVTPRDQIGLPRVPPPPSPVKCVAGPGRAKGGGNKEKKQAGEKEVPAEKGDPGHGKGDTEPDKAQEKDRTVRGVSEEEVRVMLANGYYPPGGLEPGHRRLFGAKNATGEAGDGESDVGKVGSTARAGPTVGRLSTTAPANNYYRTGSSKYYRTSNTTDDPTGPTAQPHASRPQKSSGALRKAPPIPKHSPVALPPVSRLPMMMTSPIRATAGREPDPELAKGRKGKAQKGKGVKPPEPGPVPAAEPARQFPLSLSEYSPLKRFLKSAGVDSLGDVLGQGGVLGLKGDSGWAGWGGSGSNASRAGAKAAMIKEQEREIVDLTSDAEGDDASAPVKAPALAGKSSPEKRPAAPTNVPTTPPRAPRVQPQFSTPRRTSTQPRTPRQARTSPDRAESPLFAQAVLGDAYTQDPSSEGPSIPLDLPPSSPPPMSDSDLEAGSGVDADGKDGYREAVRYTDGASSEGGLGAGEENIEDSDMERQFNPEIDPDDEDGGEWNETIRPPEPDPLEIEPATQDGGLFDGLGAGDAQLDFDTLANFLDTLGGIGTEMTSGPDPEQFDTELAGVLGQTGAHPVDSGLVPAALDFSWLDALGSSNPGEAGLETGAEGIVNLGETGGELAGHDLTEILVALGAG